jgi:penicillin-binding protein 2
LRSLDQVLTIQGRTRILLLLVAAVLTMSITAYWFFQVVRKPYFEKLAERNQYREGRIAAPRGKILDRRGLSAYNEESILVDNKTAFNLYVIPDACESLDEAVEQIGGMVNISTQEFGKIRDRRRRLLPFRPLLVKEDLTFERTAFLEARSNAYPWAEIAVYQKRNYPHGSTAAHILGHVGEITEEQLLMDEFVGVPQGALVGQTGLERRYQQILSGTDGRYQNEVDSLGRVVREVSRRHPTPGRDLILTIDMRLQKKAEELFEGKAGVLVAIDANNGEVLALVSAPAFDPNSYIENFSQMAIDESSPLLNRAISSKFSPGSVWKVLMAAAGLQEGVVNPSTELFCGGVVLLDNRYYHCHVSSGHGNMTIVPALTHSCNVFFYKVGRQLGIDKIAYWAKRFGFGEPTGIDLPYEVPGLVPTPEWKRRVRVSDWYPGETINVSIGQGSLEVTPIQMARFMAAIANGGKLVKPHIIRGIRNADGKVTIFRPPEPTEVGISDENLRYVREGIYGAVNRGGTAARARIPQISAAGKTGTAQVVRRRFGVSPEELPEEQRHHAWFVCFAPYEKPEIAVCVFVEHGGSSSLSAVPMAAEFLRAYAELRQEIQNGSEKTAE